MVACPIGRAGRAHQQFGGPADDFVAAHPNFLLRRMIDAGL
jgi:hypothetical protein